MLFPSTMQRVLALFFCHPERTYHTMELIDLVGAGSGAVQRVLAQLYASELITATEVGRRRFFRANQSAPIFRELRGLMIKTAGLVDPVRDALAPLASKIRFATIFGSIAKRVERASSDVDLLVVSDELTLEGLFEALAVAEQQIARKISPTLYTSVEFDRRRQESNAFLTKVLAGEHLDLIGHVPPEPR